MVRTINVPFTITEEIETKLMKYFVDRGLLENFQNAPEDFDEMFISWVQESIELDVLNLYR